jgi:hypothetical protein
MYRIERGKRGGTLTDRSGEHHVFLVIENRGPLVEFGNEFVAAVIDAKPEGV